MLASWKKGIPQIIRKKITLRKDKKYRVRVQF